LSHHRRHGDGQTHAAVACGEELNNAGQQHV
jgi:hypothetical protein